MAISDTAFEATQRADTANDNLLSQISSLYTIANLIYALSLTAPAWKGATNIDTTVIDVSGAPVFTDRFVSPGSPPTPTDYVAAMQNAYTFQNGTVSSEVVSAIDGWLVKYAPNYLNSATMLDATLAQGVTDGDPLGEDVQTALYTKAQNQIDTAAKASFEVAMRAVRGAGWEVVQPMQEAVLYRLAQSTADAEMEAAITAYLKTYEIRVSHKELCIKVQADIRNATQTAMVSITGVIAGLKKFALEYASEIGSLGVAEYEAQITGFKAILETNIKSFEAAVAKNSALIETYKTKLEVQLKNGALLLDKSRVQIENESLPYKGKLETAIKMYDGKVTGLNALSGSVASATGALGQYAAAAVSVMNAITASTEQV